MAPAVWVAALLCAAAAPAAVRGDTAAGWRQVDRYAGFRFEAHGQYDARRFAVAVRDMADELSGFGWVQEVANDGPPPSVGVGSDGSARGGPGNGTHLVGEFRGTKGTAPAMLAFLERGPADASGGSSGSSGSGSGGSYRLDALHYPDTRIKLHFADFKILTPERSTCFAEPPHQCRGMAAPVAAAAAAAVGADGSVRDAAPA